MTKYDKSMELSLDQLDDVIGGAGPAPMGLGGSAVTVASTHPTPASHGTFGPIHHGAIIFGHGHPAPLGIAHAPNDPAPQPAAASHDPAPVGLGGQPVVATTSVDALANDAFDPPVDAAPMGIGGWSEEHGE